MAIVVVPGHGGRGSSSASGDPGRDLTLMLAQQLPPLLGENVDNDGESFSEWIERLELVANVSRWDHQTKLVNVAFVVQPHGCTDHVHLNSDQAIRFTPVCLQSVRSSLFHERKQTQYPL